MKNLFAVIFSASLLLSVGLSNAPAAHADSNTDSKCTNATVAGSFGIQTTGTLLEGAAVQPAGPFAATGVYNLDGKGNFSTKQTYSANGQIEVLNASGTYNLEQDCTITFKFAGPTAGTQLGTSGVVVKHGTEILVIETDPGTVITAILKKI
ncbi:MAG: hypothetical protein KME46_22795 [Brasilonema angustatum HA4187-MV1]|jgi:hypothetical protein|nr:hypothetical protein [Brasilonema angustatum HA4187-MV1]